MIIPATENVNRAKIEMVIDEVEKSTARKIHYKNIPKCIWIEVERYALDHSTKNTPEKFSKHYLKLNFKRTLMNSWKTLLKNSGNNKTLNKKDRPSLLSEALLKKTKDVIISLCLAGTVISRRLVITIGTRVVKANDPGKSFASLILKPLSFFCSWHTTTHSSLSHSEKFLLQYS